VITVMITEVMSKPSDDHYTIIFIVVFSPAIPVQNCLLRQGDLLVCLGPHSSWQKPHV